jgi:hypothetical protein
MEMSGHHNKGMAMPGMGGVEDKPTFHGMLVFGAESAYFSHLPMFMAGPHRYQVIMEVTLEKAAEDQLPAIVKDREQTHTRMYSFTPTEDFVLTDLVSPPDQPRLTAFPGGIVRGHFEPGHFEPEGQEIIPDVVAQVKNVIHFNKFASHPQDLPSLQYFLFGKGQELYLAHVLNKAPDFDHVISARLTGQQFTDDELRQAVLVSFPDRTNSPKERLKEGEQLKGMAQAPGQDAAQPVEIQVTAGPEFYFETRDLEM